MAAPSHTLVKAAYWFPDGETPVSGAETDTAYHSANKIDSKLFTHLFCAYADLDPYTHKVSVTTEHWNDFHNFTYIVKEKNHKVHTLLSIGGKNDANSALISAMARDPSLRASFIESSIQTARALGFRGLDLAWEYPSSAVDMENLGLLLQEWRVAIHDESERSEELPLLLTIAVYYSSKYNSTFLYPIKSMVDNLDWVNVVAYNFYGPAWSTVTGPPAALFDTGKAAGLSIESGLKQWFDDKLPRNKIVLGLPYVGWAWTLKDDKDNGYHAATTGPAISPDGSINYDQVKSYILAQGAAAVHNPMVTGDYCYAGPTWIGYDDNQSIVNKVKFAKQNYLLGYYSWHIGADIECGLSRAGLSIESGLKQWFDDKLPQNKVVLGLPYVGWAWSLKDDKDNGYHAATTGPAISPHGSINYDQVKSYILAQGAAAVHNPMVTGDYCYAGPTWIGYDDKQSIINKVKFAKQNSLLGYYSWHIGADIECGLFHGASRACDATEV